jgi:hypothetical protein
MTCSEIFSAGKWQKLLEMFLLALNDHFLAQDRPKELEKSAQDTWDVCTPNTLASSSETCLVCIFFTCTMFNSPWAQLQSPQKKLAGRDKKGT